MRPYLSPWRNRNRCFWATLCHMIVSRPNLDVVTKRVLYQQVKIIGSLVLWCAWKCVSAGISGGVSIPKVTGWHLLQQISSRTGSQSRYVTEDISLLSILSLPSWFYLNFLVQWNGQFSRVCKPGNSESP